MFIKPSVLDISQYCLERKNGIDPEAFYAFYESKGWMIGKNKMTSWKFAVHTWEKRQPKEPPEKVLPKHVKDEWAKWKADQEKAKREGKLATKEQLAALVEAFKRVVIAFNQRSLMLKGRSNVVRIHHGTSKEGSGKRDDPQMSEQGKNTLLQRASAVGK